MDDLAVDVAHRLDESTRIPPKYLTYHLTRQWRSEIRPHPHEEYCPCDERGYIQTPGRRERQIPYQQ